MKQSQLEMVLMLIATFLGIMLLMALLIYLA